MMSVLPNGGLLRGHNIRRSQTLHSMMSVLPNGGLFRASTTPAHAAAALDDVSATEWRRLSPACERLR